MSYVTNRKRKPPLSDVELLVLNVVAKAETVGARRALALAVKSGNLQDGRSLSQHWAALAAAKAEYSSALAELTALLKKRLDSPAKAG